MLKQTVESRKLGKILILIMIVINVFLFGRYVTKCFYEWENRPNEFTIRVFDGWTGEERKEYERYYYDYKGYQIHFVIKVYCNGKEIYETSLKDAMNNEGPGSLIEVRATYKEFYSDSCKTEQGHIHPVEKGWYTYIIEFNRMYHWKGEPIYKDNLSDFFLDFYIDYDHYMSIKEG